MHIHRSSLLLRISLSIFALALTAAIPPADLTPGSGVTLLTLMSAPPTVCVGESAPVEIFIQDLVYGIPPGATLVTMTSRLGGSETIMTIGGPTTLNYKPVREGEDTIEISTMNVYSMPGFLSLPAHVEGCKWTWKFTYSGTYPNPKGFWTFYEDATVADGTLEVMTTYGHELELKGEGTVDVSVDQNGSDESTTCALDQPPEGSASVQVTGRLNQPMPGMMQVHFSFDPVNLSGGGKFHCQVMDSQNIIPFALPSTTFDVNALSLSSVVVSTDSDSLSWPVPQAILWELPGSGSFEFKFTRVSR